MIISEQGKGAFEKAKGLLYLHQRQVQNLNKTMGI
jgi:hypothetical protein